MSKTPDMSEFRGQPSFSTRLNQGSTARELNRAKYVSKLDFSSQDPQEKGSSPLSTIATGVAIAGSLIGGAAENVNAGIYEAIPTDFETSRTAYDKYVTDLNGVKPEKTPEARPLAEISPYGPSMEVTEEWLRQNPQNILVFTDFKDQDGNVSEKYTVVDHGYYDSGLNYHPVPVLYRAVPNSTTKKFEQYQPVNNLTGKIHPNSIIKVGNKLIIAGEATYRGADTAVFVSSDDGKTGELIPWEYQNSGSTHSLKEINNNTVYAGNGQTPNGVGQYIIYLDQNTTAARIQAVGDTIKATNLESAAMPEITHYNPLTNKITVVSSAMESPWQTGFNASTIDVASATGFTENLLPNLGLITAITHYKTSSGEYILANGHPFDNLLFNVRLDSATGKPVAEESRIYYGGWMDNKGIPDIIKDSFNVIDIHTFVDTNNRVHVRVLGSYQDIQGLVGSRRSVEHAILGHFILGTDLNTDPSLFDYIDLGPADLRTDAYDFQEKMVNGERMLEFRVSGLKFGLDGPTNPDDHNHKFSGIRAVRIPADGSFDKQLFNPNNGLEQMPADPAPTPTPTPTPKPTWVPKFFANLPIVAKEAIGKIAGGW